MKKTLLFIYWAALYILCALFGLLPLPGNAGSVIMVLLSLVFFLPGALLVYQGIRERDRKLLRSIRIISLCSLTVTLILLIVSFFTVLSTPQVGLTVHILLTLFSVPMVCSGYWILSLFLWACLLMSTLIFPKRT